MRATFYTTEQLGLRQSLTPEGFLLISGVPIARTGEMLYGPDEVPVTPGTDGVIRILREAEHVFADAHVASYNGKPIVNDHPDEDVTPENWRDLAGGVVINPQRGDGEFSDCIVADLLVCNKDEIAAVRAGKREVSCGYSADYEELAPGIGRQLNLVGNHVALVVAGRCGPRCAIGDKQQKEMTMATRDKRLSWLDRIRLALNAKDEAGALKVLDEAEAETKDDNGGTEPTAVHINVLSGDKDDEGMEERMKKTEDGLRDVQTAVADVAKMVKSLDAKLGTRDANEDDDEDKKKKAEDAVAEEVAEETGGTKDSVRARSGDSLLVAGGHLLAESFQDTVACAEILVAGIRIPTYDRAASAKATLDTICKLRRTALDLAYNSPDGRAIIEEINRKPLVLDGMSGAAVRALFNGAVASKRASNNATRVSDDELRLTTAGTQVKGTVRSIADLNAMNAKRYGGAA